VKLTAGDFVRKMKFSLTHKDYRAVFFGYLFTNLASAIIYTIGLHTFTYTFHMDNYKIGIVLGAQFVVSIITQPIWAKISERIDKNNAVKLGLKISVVGCLILFGLTFFREAVQAHYQYLLIYSVVIGAGTSVLFSIPFSMIADTVDLQELETGERNEGMYYGMLTFGYKISQSLAIIILGFAIDLIRFDATLTIQSSSTEILLGMLLSLGSIIAFLLAGLAYKGYSLNKKSVMAIQAEISLKKIEL
jgi:Na+/melibiose symporter-like transporter